MQITATQWFALGNDAWQRGDLLQAERAFHQAICREATLVEAYGNIGLLRARRGDQTGALRWLDYAVQLAPRHAGLHLNLGAHYLRAEQPARAQRHLELALQLDPTLAAAWSNLGMALALQEQREAALAALRRALALAPGSTETQTNLGYVLMQLGRWAEGWPWLDSARRARTIGALVECPRWAGGELTGLRLLLEHEAGHGDTVQFARYIPLLKARGAAYVGLVCQPALVRLLRPLPGLDAVWALDDGVPAQGWDAWSPMISLARHLVPAAQDPVHLAPYVQVADSVRQSWAQRIAARGRRVGLVWRGNPNFANDRHRSLTRVEDLEPVWSQTGITFYSLQAGSRDNLPAAICDLAPQLRDFADTAAVLEQLDLLISVDSAVAHVAGALGRPCWLLLPHHLCDWRWGLDRSDTPWYPATRLFRQGGDGTWAPVVAQVAQALRHWPPGTQAAVLAP